MIANSAVKMRPNSDSKAIKKYLEKLEKFSKIAKSHPHPAHIAYTKGYKSKFTFCMRTIESFEDYTDPIHDVIHEMLLSTLFGQVKPLLDELQEVITLAQGVV